MTSSSYRSPSPLTWNHAFTFVVLEKEIWGTQLLTTPNAMVGPVVLLELEEIFRHVTSLVLPGATALPRITTATAL